MKRPAVGWLSVGSWGRGPEKGQTYVYWSNVRKVLGLGPGGHQAFPDHVLLLYRALVLDSRAQVISSAQATLANPGQTLHHFEADTRKHLVRVGRRMNRSHAHPVGDSMRARRQALSLCVTSLRAPAEHGPPTSGAAMEHPDLG